MADHFLNLVELVSKEQGLRHHFRAQTILDIPRIRSRLKEKFDDPDVSRAQSDREGGGVLRVVIGKVHAGPGAAATFAMLLLLAEEWIFDPFADV